MRPTSVRPGAFHCGIAGLTMLLNVYTTQGGIWSTTAIVSFAIVGTCLCCMVASTVVYEVILLARLRAGRSRRRIV